MFSYGVPCSVISEQREAPQGAVLGICSGIKYIIRSLKKKKKKSAANADTNFTFAIPPVLKFLYFRVPKTATPTFRPKTRTTRASPAFRYYTPRFPQDPLPTRLSHVPILRTKSTFSKTYILAAQGVPVFQYYFCRPEHATQLQPTSTNHNIFPKNPSPATLHQTLHETYKTPFFSSPKLPRAKNLIFHH